MSKLFFILVCLSLIKAEEFIEQFNANNLYEFAFNEDLALKTIKNQIIPNIKNSSELVLLAYIFQRYPEEGYFVALVANYNRNTDPFNNDIELLNDYFVYRGQTSKLKLETEIASVAEINKKIKRIKKLFCNNMNNNISDDELKVELSFSKTSYLFIKSSDSNFFHGGIVRDFKKDSEIIKIIDEIYKLK